jgi:isoquinoline 1-oxidoreductase beta subunit
MMLPTNRGGLAKVRIQQSEGDEKKYGNQDTDGCARAHFIQPMRLCGASARTMLEQAAAKREA